MMLLFLLFSVLLCAKRSVNTNFGIDGVINRFAGIAVNEDGYWAGTYYSDLNDDFELFITKFDHLDTELKQSWSKKAGSLENEMFHGWVQTSDKNFVAVGHTNFIPFIMKFNASNGRVLWKKKRIAASQSEELYAVAEDPSNGDLVACGYSKNFGNSQKTPMIVKFSSTGTASWQRGWNQATNIRSGYCRGVAVLSTGDIVTTGYLDFHTGSESDWNLFMWGVNSAGDTDNYMRKVWNNYVTTVNGLHLLADETYVVVTGKISPDKTQMLAYKFKTADGLRVWCKWIESGNGMTMTGDAITETASGDIIVVGSGNMVEGRGLDAVVVKYTTNGAITWVRMTDYNDDNEDDYARRVVELDGDLYVGGEYTIDGGPNMRNWFARLSVTIDVDKEGCGWEEYTNYTWKANDCGNEFVISGATIFTETWPYDDWSIGFGWGDVSFTQDWYCGQICPPYYYSDKCDVYSCGGALSNETLCTGHGSCTVGGGQCSCNPDWYSTECDVYACGDGLSNETMCGGHGTCTTAGGECGCGQYYYGRYCGVFECGGYMSNETNICSDLGTCTIGGGVCVCNQYRHGKDCTVYECDGFFSNMTAGEICFGHGTCETPGGKCVCDAMFETARCMVETPASESSGRIVAVCLLVMLVVLLSL